ncbi:FAD-dependent monooxygenase [Streptomyces kunmingensis]|uniref:FAD-dependent monooxygenase n=1 Tax=Streptomyces kunmingensis TaxID=68225 RepID=A0ABU6CJK8_9ACTN|nr:FAD-dependent monooxygenase [Streptomyces kunmingensis]
MLACELALAGVRPVVLERLAGPKTEPRANGLVGQVVRMLDRRGLYSRISGSSEPPRPATRYMFGAFTLDLTGLDDNPVSLLPAPSQARTAACTFPATGACHPCCTCARRAARSRGACCLAECQSSTPPKPAGRTSTPPR